jgi:hypothetical protein
VGVAAAVEVVKVVEVAEVAEVAEVVQLVEIVDIGDIVVDVVVAAAAAHRGAAAVIVEWMQFLAHWQKKEDAVGGRKRRPGSQWSWNGGRLRRLSFWHVLQQWKLEGVGPDEI